MHGYNTYVPAPPGTPREHDDDENHPFAGQAKFSLTQAMSSMLALGLTLEQVVPMVTTNAAAMIGLSDEIGALKPGMEADVSVLGDERGRFMLRDNEKNEVIAERLLQPAFCLRAGTRYDADGADPAAGRGGIEVSVGSIEESVTVRNEREFSSAGAGAGQGVGARLPRKEDDRLMRGRGQFVADIRLAGMQDVAFVRSPLAHARIRGIHVPERYRGSVFTAADLDGVKPIRAVSGLPGFKVSEQPVLATGKVRQVGELVAMCVAPTRAEAEDIAAAVDARSRRAARRLRHARRASRRGARARALGRQRLSRNQFVEVDIAKALDAPIKVTREISTARQCMAPLEGRGVVATLDSRLDQLTSIPATQMPHIVRTGLSECLGLEQGRIRVISPDVGGGFGYKGILLPEEVCLCWLAMRCGHPVRWIEDRREHLTAGANCREHHYRITAYADRDGRLRGIDCEATVDSGAYSSYPFSACLEAAQVASILPGPYDSGLSLPDLFGRHQQMPDPALSRRRAHRRLLRARAGARRRRPRKPASSRAKCACKNLVRPEQMPFDNITKKHFDSGDYPEALRRALARSTSPACARASARASPTAG